MAESRKTFKKLKIIKLIEIWQISEWGYNKKYSDLENEKV